MDQAGGAALSLWASQADRPGAVRLALDGNTIRAGRVLAVAGLSAGWEATARGNDFRFSQALVGASGQDGARRFTWHGRDNSYHASADWLLVDGRPAGVRTLAAWRAATRDDEPGSRE